MGTAHLDWVKQTPNDGLIRVLILTREVLLVTNPKAVDELMNIRSYDFQKDPEQRKVFAYFLGEGGMSAVDGDRHKYLRKAIGPAFSHRRVRNMYSSFWNKSIQLANGVAQQVAEKASEQTGPGDDAPTAVIEMTHWANKATLVSE
jgi:cytochrome P450